MRDYAIQAHLFVRGLRARMRASMRRHHCTLLTQ